jgi:hypothetical protein
MSTTKEQLIAWLEKLPAGTEVQILTSTPNTGWDGGDNVSVKDLVLQDIPVNEYEPDKLASTFADTFTFEQGWVYEKEGRVYPPVLTLGNEG